MKNVLFITSISPNKSAGLALDVISVFENLGYTVDILTKYKEKEKEDTKHTIISVYDYPELNVIQIFLQRIKKQFPLLKRIHKPSYYLSKQNKKTTYSSLVNEKEDVPPVSSELFLHKLSNTEYDFVVVLFMQYMFSMKNIGDIYQKLKLPIFLYSVDLSPMSGGCHYFENCRNFLEHCGCCPILGGAEQKDQTYKNYAYKKKIYDTSNIIFLGNTWMNEFAAKAPIFENVQIREMTCATNESLFDVKNKKEARQYFGIEDDCFLMFAGAAYINNPRKGFDYLIKSINTFIQTTGTDNKKILLLLAGNEAYNVNFNVEVKQVGFLSAKELSLAYSAADVFLSPTIEDAGPSMVNQSLMCGTPVVSFNIGVALDLVEDYKTGVKATLKNTDEFAKAIQWIYSIDEEEREEVKNRCRQKAIETCSIKAIESKFTQLIAEFVAVK
jgi:glycosyltransferase involved in cell wall biosynthesis